MRAPEMDISIDRKGRRLQRMTFAQRAELRRRYVANIPRWRHPLVGYLASIPLITIATYGTLSLRDMLGVFHFSGTLLSLAVLFVAIFWGVGPSLFSVLISTLILDYYVIPPTGDFSLNKWQGALQLIPFVISGITIAIITAQRERARLKALAAEQELQSYASELEEINQKLEDANKTKDRFLSIASHELKTPITTIRGQTQLALRRISKQKEVPSDVEMTRASLERINDQTARLTALIDELMDVSSMRAGKVELHKKKCDLRGICREVVEDQRLLTGRSIKLAMPVEPVKMNIDSDRISQVMVNLVSNAIKYSPERSVIEVSLSQSEGTVLIQVCDQGKGIARDQIERIFDTFYRTPDAQSSTKQGLGLGLAISKGIVERHGGRIWCESEVDKGSMFCVEMPVK